MIGESIFRELTMEAGICRRSWARIGVTVAALTVVSGASVLGTSTERFVTVNGVRLHYIDWGGTGPTLLLLTSLRASAHEFDEFAPRFTDRFHVLGLTRRGKDPSDKPASGYDTTTLAEDINGFLDALRIGRVSLAGYSVSADEETRFAVLHPDRVEKLVYLDGAYDRKTAAELAKDPAYGLVLPQFDGPIGEVAKGSIAADPDYLSVRAPALAFYVIPEGPAIPSGVTGEVEAKLRVGWRDYGEKFMWRQINRFRQEMKSGRVVELHNTDHRRFLIDPVPQAIVVSEMRTFLIK
jgi:pimeloyl-ACP methyl ester carboxylesterase